MGDRVGTLSDTANLIGRVFDNRYQIVELIGRGGMSAVYKAVQLSMGKTVAVKVMARTLCEDERLLMRFNQEALASSRLRHPNTIKVLDYGQAEENYLFLAMEYLEGSTLGHVIKREAPLDPRRACKIARQACKSLAEAHRVGIVHRDLKPDNVFLSDIYGERDFVKVLDFGIAKFITEGTQETLTQTGFICGTPLYLSPEQGLGRALDFRTDLYSLGIIIYEMLLGDTPFRGDTPINVVMKHIHEQAPSFREKHPDVRVPKPLETLVMSMLSKDLDLRPSSAEEVGERLDELLESGTLAGGRPARRVPPRPRADESQPVSGPSGPPSSDGVVSMHANDRPTMFLGVNEVHAAHAERTAQKGGRTKAMPADWTPDPGTEAPDWEDRTVLITPGGLPPDDDDDDERTRLTPVTPSEGTYAGGADDASTVAVDMRSPAAAASAAPDGVYDDGEPSPVRYLAVAALVLAVLGGAAWLLRGHWMPLFDSEAVAAAEQPGPELPETPEKVAATEEPGAPAEPEAEQEAFVVTIETEPPGASVLDGQIIRGKTPLLLTLSPSDGARSLTLRQEGFREEVVLVDPQLVESGGIVVVKLNAAEPPPAEEAPSVAATEGAGAPAAPAEPATPGEQEEPAPSPAAEATDEQEPAAAEATAAVPEPPTEPEEPAKSKPAKKKPKKKPKKKSKKKKSSQSMEWKDW